MMIILAIYNALLLATALIPLAIVDADCIGICLDPEEGQPQQQQGDEENTPPESLFNPADEDPEWPGVLPPPESLYEVVINIRYDDYPAETSWVLEQLIPATSSSAAFKQAGATGDEWVLLDSYDGSNEHGGTLESYRSFRSPQSLYRFQITDDFDDGICCDYGNGWLTLTNRTGVLWSLYGNAFTDLAEVYFSMDEEGNTAVVNAPEPDFFDPIILADVSSWLPNYTLETLSTATNSPQKDALLWTLDHPDYSGMPTWRKQQVFGLSSFLYSTGTGGTRWLNYSISECQWVFRESDIGELVDRCGVDGTFQTLDNTETYTLTGSIPPELSLVKSLTDIGLSNQHIGSSLPTELFSLSLLSELWIAYNEFTGIGLPTEFGLLTSLTSLHYGGNTFTGTVPTELANLSNLGYVYLGDTLIEGKIPTGFCNANLAWIDLYCSRISCPCVECRCSDEWGW